MLPVQTKRTFFTVGTRSERVYQTRSEPVQVNFPWSKGVVSSVIFVASRSGALRLL
jgi:hypothetical protein